MTIICALKAEGGVWIGSDTMAQNGYLAEDVGPKWFPLGGWWLGISGQMRLQTLMRQRITEYQSAEQICEDIRAQVLADGWEPIKEAGQPSSYGFAAVLTNGVDAWSLCGRFSVMKAQGFVAVGSGSEFAYGAAFALRNRDVHPESILTIAIKSATEQCTSCGGAPFTRFIRP